MAVTGDLMVIVIGRCCVRGMGSSTPLWHIEAILVLTNATSGLYPLFHRALSKYLGSFASWMREKLRVKAHMCFNIRGRNGSMRRVITAGDLASGP